jgi:hypothetical protein
MVFDFSLSARRAKLIWTNLLNLSDCCPQVTCFGDRLDGLVIACIRNEE